MRNDKKVIKQLKKDGWTLDRVNGSHHIFTHPAASRSITVAVHSADMSNNMMNVIMKQAEAALRG